MTDANTDTQAAEKEASDGTDNPALLAFIRSYDDGQVVRREPHDIDKITSKSKGENMKYVRLEGDAVKLDLALPDAAADELREKLA